MVDTLQRLKVHTIAAGAANQTIADLEGLNGNILYVDAGGGAIDLTLPPEANAAGIGIHIFNVSDAAEAITVKDDGASTIIVLAQDEGGFVACDGTTWHGYVGAET
jgi:hypothetical protein